MFETAYQFCQRVLPPGHVYFSSTNLPGRHWQDCSTKDLALLVQTQLTAAPEGDVYLALSGYADPNAGRRQTNAVAQKALWLDVDCGKHDSPYPDARAGSQALTGFIRAAGLSGPLVVFSGSRLHACLERSLKSRHDHDGWEPGDWEVKEVTAPVVAMIHKLMAQNWRVHAELSAAVSPAGAETDFFDNEGYLRCKIDVAAIAPDGSKGYLWDWKSGRTPGKRQQFELNALALVPLYGLIPYECFFFYFDQRKADKHSVRLPFANLAAISEGQAGPLAPLVKSCRDLQASWIQDNWPQTPGAGCRWCAMDCEHKGRRI